MHARRAYRVLRRAETPLARLATVTREEGQGWLSVIPSRLGRRGRKTTLLVGGISGTRWARTKPRGMCTWEPGRTMYSNFPLPLNGNLCGKRGEARQEYGFWPHCNTASRGIMSTDKTKFMRPTFSILPLSCAHLACVHYLSRRRARSQRT